LITGRMEALHAADSFFPKCFQGLASEWDVPQRRLCVNCIGIRTDRDPAR
jgi:hypothetical protein